MKLIPRILLASCAAAIAFPCTLMAQDQYPSKTIHFISPAPPGGLSDTIPRLLSLELERVMKTTVVVENKPGAGGTIATSFVAKAPADGYNLLLGTGGMMTINPYTYANLPFDTAKDFTAIAMLAYTPLYLAVRGDSPYKTVADLVAAAKAKSGELAYGTIGPGSTASIASGLLVRAKDIKMIDVPFSGYGPAMTELLGGRLAFTMLDGGALSQFQSGALRALAVTTAERAAAFPDVPTLKETGIDLDIAVWFGVYARAGLPQKTSETLRLAVKEAMAQPSFRKALAPFGLEPGKQFGDDFQKFTHAEIARYKTALPALGVQPAK